MKPSYRISFSKRETLARIDFTTSFDSYDEISKSVRSDFAESEANNEISKASVRYTKSIAVNYLYMLGDLISCDAPFEYLKELFVAVNDKFLPFFETQLLLAQADCREYVDCNNFSIDYFDRFTNSKRIKLQRTMCEVVNDRFIILRIDSNADDVVYCYESTKITDVLFATIHFALENGYKLIKCKHCERWYFTQTLKEVFCKRTSPCFGMIVNDKVLLRQKQPCRNAVDTIKKRLQDRKNVIYHKWYESQSDCFCDFNYECEDCPRRNGMCPVEDRCAFLCQNYEVLKRNITKSPTVENIVKLHQFLYSDDMPKQERPNRRKSNNSIDKVDN